MTSPHNLAVTLPRITRVGIADLADVAEHRVNNVYGSISHHIRFHSGGVVNVAYAADGSLLEFTGEGLSLSINADGILTVKPYCPPQAD